MRHGLVDGTRAAAALAAALLAGCGGGATLDSRWRDREIVVDGDTAEWADATYWNDEAKVSVGLMNDADYAWVSLASNDRDLARLVTTRGLEVWFDAEGGEERRFGVRYPLPPEGPRRFDPPAGPRERRRGAEPDSAAEAARAAEARERLAERLGEVEILTAAGADRRGLSEAERLGIRAQVRVQPGRVVYELRVPLARSTEHPFVVGETRKGVVGVGVRTPDFDFDDRRRPPGGAFGGGGMAGRPGMGTPGGTGPGGRRGSFDEPLDVWVKVRLARAPAGSPG